MARRYPCGYHVPMTKKKKSPPALLFFGLI
ncbi:hypothetical protein DFAR_3460066 [Desulfarculales bacterium]